MELNLPAWVQQITVFFVGIASLIVGIWKYFKTQTDKISPTPTKHEEASTAAPSAFADNKLIRELIDTLREHQEEAGRQSQRVTRSQGELRETIIEANESMHVNTNSLLNLTRFLNRQSVSKEDK